MNHFYATTLNEVEKMFHRKKAIFYLVITLLIPAVLAVGFSFFQNRLGVTPSLDFPVFNLGLFTNYLLPLFIFTLAADVFAGEVADHTLKLTLTRPVSRFQVFAAKNTAMVFYVALTLVVAYFISMVSWMILNGAGITLGGVFNGLKAYTVALVPMLLVTLVASCLSQFFKSSSGALTTSLLVFLACWSLSFISPLIGRLSPFHYTDWHLLWLGQTTGWASIGIAFLFLLSYSLLFFIAGFGLFDRKEL